MPLRDHFHPPLSEERGWPTIHHHWIAEIAAYLNEELLPEGFYAESECAIGGHLEIDVASLDEITNGHNFHPTNNGVATLSWAPPAATGVIALAVPDSIEARIISTVSGRTVVAAIEIVSPSNKDRAESRAAFVAKCQSFLTAGVGLIVVDIVTNRRANLHQELMLALGQPRRVATDDSPIYAAAYRPSRVKEEGDRLEFWSHELEIGELLPELPLALRNGPIYPLDLERTYESACRRNRIV